ncbi:TBCC domain-containing protein 1-like [Clavelina lepadiformis]|uniref:TBCC domain-containing protein 1-like n=1 Tax=Clavelina lepadiformis TaxID=159417 RepID=UPI00404324E7
MSEVELWLHPDIFYYGIVYAHPKLTLPYLKKVVAYAKNKGKDGGYPSLSWTVWKHMAVNKMLMKEDLAWTYFQMFYTLHDFTANERLEHAELQHQMLESGDAKSYRSCMQVPTLEFVFFLYLQQANKVSLRRSLVGEEWPGASPRSCIESPSHQNKSEATANMLDEHKHIQFVVSHIYQIFELLSDDFKSQEMSNQDSNLSVDVVKALGYVIKGRIMKQTNVLSVYDIATRHRLQGKAGYSRSAGTFTAQTLERWIQANLTDNPFGLTSCITSGTRLKWNSPASSSETARRKARIIANSSSAPTGHKLVFFTQCSNQTIARQSAFLSGSYVKLHRCQRSCFYLLSPLKCATIEKCNRMTIVLGPVSTCIKLVNCQDILLIAPCQSITVANCTGITLHIATPTQPIILSDGMSTDDVEASIVLAPYNTFYSNLEIHLAQVGLPISPQIDQWKNPICISNVHNLSHNHSRLSDVVQPRSPRYSAVGDAPLAAEKGKFYRIMTPAEFYMFSIPFQISETMINGVTTSEIPGGLPEEYSQAVKAKQRATERWKKAVKESQMTKEERNSFQQLVEEKFKQWLTESGNQRQIDDLRK